MDATKTLKGRKTSGLDSNSVEYGINSTIELMVKIFNRCMKIAGGLELGG